MRPPSAAQSRAGAVAPAPRGFPVVACPDSIARDTRCLLLTGESLRTSTGIPERAQRAAVELAVGVLGDRVDDDDRRRDLEGHEGGAAVLEECRWLRAPAGAGDDEADRDLTIDVVAHAERGG